MRPMITAVALSLAASGAAAQQQEELALPFARTIEVAQGTPIRIRGTGDVEVTVGQAGRVALEASAGARDPRTARLYTFRDDGELIVCVVTGEYRCDEDGIHGNGESRWRGVNLRVQVPPGSAIGAGSGMGDVAVRGVRERVNASSGNGDVRVERAGAEVRASSGNGSVWVETSGGPVNATSGNGDVHASIGRVPDGARMRFSSGNGDIVLTLPEGTGAEIEASFGNGGLRSDFPLTLEGGFSRHRVRGTIGGGGARITASSGNGDLVIRRQ